MEARKEIDNAVLFPSSVVMAHLIPSRPCNNGICYYTCVLEFQKININIHGLTMCVSI